MEGESSGSLMKRTLITVLAMVSACIVFVGVVSLVAVTVVNRAVQPAQGADRDPMTAPAGNGSPSDGKSQPTPKPPSKSQI